MSQEIFAFMCKQSQESLKAYVYDKLKKTYKNATKGDGYVYAEGSFPVLLVAHLDTVHKQLPSKIQICKNGKISSPDGIGGDDRCGVYMIFEIIKEINCSVLFCEDEEIGTVGAKKFISTKLADSLIEKFNYIIEFDRKGNKDAVFYDCGNADFEKFITRDFYKTAFGSFSDISTIAPHLGCAAVNLSCGYYNAHTKDEYVMWSEMQKSIEEAIKILNRTTETDKFEYIPVLKANKYYENWYGDYDWDYDYGYGCNAQEKIYDIYYMNDNNCMCDCTLIASSKMEAIGAFCMNYPDLTFNHIIDITCDDEIYQ